MAEHAHVSSEVAWRQGAAWAKSAGTWSRLSSPLSEGQGCRGQRPTLKAPPPPTFPSPGAVEAATQTDALVVFWPRSIWLSGNLREKVLGP